MISWATFLGQVSIELTVTKAAAACLATTAVGASARADATVTNWRIISN
jgi:hypothetical protein